MKKRFSITYNYLELTESSSYTYIRMHHFLHDRKKNHDEKLMVTFRVKYETIMKLHSNYEFIYFFLRTLFTI